MNTAAPVPTHPSNRSMIDQLEKWGILFVSKSGDRWRARFPGGETLPLFAPTHHRGNPSDIFAEVYRLLGVTPSKFWNEPPSAPKPVLALPPPAQSPRRPPRRNYINLVVDSLIQFGAPMSIDRIAQEVGITKTQASQACSALVDGEPPLIERMKPGVYCAVEYASDYRIGVDVSVGSADGTNQRSAVLTDPPVAETVPVHLPPTLDAFVEPPAPALPDLLPTFPLTPAADEIDEVMESVLDLLFPEGMQITASDLRIISAWIESTKLLLRRVRSVAS